jgi:hypothetical protein
MWVVREWGEVARRAGEGSASQRNKMRAITTGQIHESIASFHRARLALPNGIPALFFVPRY